MTSISLTISSKGENHVGNQTIGRMVPGFTLEHIKKGCPIIIDLNASFSSKYNDPNAYLGLSPDFCGSLKDELWNEMIKLNWDTKYFCTRRKQVVNKRARSNLVFAHGITQEPDYANGKGRIYDTTKLPAMNALCDRLEKHFATCGYEFAREDFVIEGNLYPNGDGYIGFHGDSERKMVAAIRLGAPNPLYFGWWQYRQSANCISFVPGTMTCVVPKGGDLYMMTEKAVGTDWGHGRNKLPHLRHAAGNLLTLLNNSAWKPYNDDTSSLQRLIAPKGDDIGFDSEIRFPLGSSNSVLGPLGVILFHQKVHARKEKKWWNIYFEHVKPAKEDSDEVSD